MVLLQQGKGLGSVPTQTSVSGKPRDGGPGPGEMGERLSLLWLQCLHWSLEWPCWSGHLPARDQGFAQTHAAQHVDSMV